MAHRKRISRGFSLLELLAVLTIVGVLYALVMPQYRQHVLRSNRTDGQALLVDAAARQARHYAQHQHYITSTSALDELQMTNSANGEVRSNKGLYRLTSEPGDGGYRLRAEPLGAQRVDTACATLLLDGIGRTGTTGTVSALECWR
jgi:type IV pilus assembly protein PilE